VVATLVPRLIAYPIAALSGLTGLLLLLKAVRLRRDHRRDEGANRADTDPGGLA
jgi:hypothetical protein